MLGYSPGPTHASSSGAGGGHSGHWEDGSEAEAAVVEPGRTIGALGDPLRQGRAAHMRHPARLLLFPGTVVVYGCKAIADILKEACRLQVVVDCSPASLSQIRPEPYLCQGHRKGLSFSAQLQSLDFMTYFLALHP